MLSVVGAFFDSLNTFTLKIIQTFFLKYKNESVLTEIKRPLCSSDSMKGPPLRALKAASGCKVASFPHLVYRIFSLYSTNLYFFPLFYECRSIPFSCCFRGLQGSITIEMSVYYSLLISPLARLVVLIDHTERSMAVLWMTALFEEQRLFYWLLSWTIDFLSGYGVANCLFLSNLPSV